MKGDYELFLQFLLTLSNNTTLGVLRVLPLLSFFFHYSLCNFDKANLFQAYNSQMNARLSLRQTGNYFSGTK